MTPAAKVKINAYDNSKPAFASVNASLAVTAKNAFATAQALTGIGAAGVVVAMAALTRNAIAYGSALTDASKATGVSVENLQVLRMMADKAGASHSGLEKALVRAQKAAMDSANGLSTYTRAFDALNINVQDFIKLPAERKLEAIGKAMANTKNKQAAYVAAVDILGSRNAPALMEVLQDLAHDGFDETARAAREAGQIMSEETAQSMDAMADAMVRIKRKMVNAWSGFVVSSAVLVGMDDLNVKIAYTTQEIERAKKRLSEMEKNKGFGHWAAILTPLDEKEQKQYLDKLQADLDAFLGERNAKLAAIDQAGMDTSMPGNAADIGVGYASAMDRANAAQERFAKSQRTAAEQTAFLKSRLTGLNTELAELALVRGKETEDYQNKLAETFKVRLELANLEKRATKEQIAATEQWKNANLTAQLMVVNAMKNASDEMTDAFMDFVETGEFEFDNMVSAWLKSLARLTFQQGVANPIMQFASGLIGGMVSGGTDTGGADMLSHIDSLPTYHTGGIAGLAPNEIGAVLQKGEEVLTEADPRHRNNQGGGESVQVNFQITANDTRGFDQLLVDRKQIIVGVINEAMARRGRGGY